MNELLDKLTSYNIFNHLLPGSIFAYCADRYFVPGILPEDLLMAAFLYYFLGVVVSRFGSLILEPLLRRAKALNFSQYEDFVAASKADEKLEVLVETANMYRTFASLFILLFLLGGYISVESRYPIMAPYRGFISCLVLGVLFFVSYLKQSQYVSDRVASNLD